MGTSFDGNDVNNIFKFFLNICIRIYYFIFLLIQAKNKMHQKSWVNPGIITYCKQKGNYKRNHRIIIIIIIIVIVTIIIILLLHLILHITLKYSLWL